MTEIYIYEAYIICIHTIYTRFILHIYIHIYKYTYTKYVYFGEKNIYILQNVIHLGV